VVEAVADPDPFCPVDTTGFVTVTDAGWAVDPCHVYVTVVVCPPVPSSFRYTVDSAGKNNSSPSTVRDR